ncbi:Ni/Fe hydrogenase subunit alpha [Pelagicoccus mobilis]|uniref:Ni/Fe hydrogenase subunit alpha n=1 Tax=Pelagicoccus mobilis TaxID=415221 RepID=A0A934RVK7_9BACT|nr:Ni/Fe hydrogenase subunit alpha [Pelagicoccus mobilis]MBK1876240.1 Ni/Fe hydrogenase subunit alpha [Pelagicoccus mobilis]
MSHSQRNPGGPSKRKKITVNYMARVEGEGGLDIRFRNGKVEDVKLNIFEPPRFYEAFLRGRSYTEPPDITARICGICPIAYQMSSTHAIESIVGIKPTDTLRELRRLIYCGEWIESHVLHVYMLHAPDFLGYQDAIRMSKDHPDLVKKGLRLKKIGNEIVNTIGGREIHPINVRIGGFYKLPTKKELIPLQNHLEEALELAKEMVTVTAGLEFPEFEQDYEYVCLRHPYEYPLNQGRIVSNKGIDIDVSEFLDHFQEEQVKHSTSLHARIKERGAYHVGPLARYSLNFDRLSPLAQEAAQQAGLGETCYNPFKSIIIRSVETLWAVEEALRIIDNYSKPEKDYIEHSPRAGTGHGCTEAPRGILYHRYKTDEEGLITDAIITPPTSQNQKMIEDDLWHFAEKYTELPDEDLKWKCEQAVRNYDPCISCSCHFLKVTVDRDGKVSKV